MRLRAKKDTNHNEIAEAFKRLGFTVADTSQLGGGFPDMVVGRRGLNFLVEVKDGKLPPSKRLLTPDEKEFLSAWNGQAYIIYCVDDVIRIFS